MRYLLVLTVIISLSFTREIDVNKHLNTLSNIKVQVASFDFSKKSPKDLLEMLKNPNNKRAGNNAISFMLQAPIGWVSKNDLKDIMPFINSMDTCKCLISPLSSTHYPNEFSIISGHAVELIESYRKQTKYPTGFYSCPVTDNNTIREIQLWWMKNK